MSDGNGGYNACRLCCQCQSGADEQNGPCATRPGFSVGDRKLDWLVSVAVKHCQDFGMETYSRRLMESVFRYSRAIYSVCYKQCESAWTTFPFAGISNNLLDLNYTASSRLSQHRWRHTVRFTKHSERQRPGDTGYGLRIVKFQSTPRALLECWRWKLFD